LMGEFWWGFGGSQVGWMALGVACGVTEEAGGSAGLKGPKQARVIHKKY